MITVSLSAVTFLEPDRIAKVLYVLAAFFPITGFVVTILNLQVLKKIATTVC